MNNIEITKRPFTQLFNAVHFVIQAKAKETTRYAIGCIYVSKEHIVATDGRRLHWTDIEHPEWDEGLYDVVKCTQSHIFLKPSSETTNFPKWQDIIPDHKLYFRGYDLPQIYVGLGQKNIAIDPAYLKQAVIKDEPARILIGNFDQPILLKYETAKCTALIMPVNIDKIEYIKVPEKVKAKKTKKRRKK